MHFIYVRSERDKDEMLALGYTLMKEDKRNSIWVFKNKNAESFSINSEMAASGIKFVMSNTLTF